MAKPSSKTSKSRSAKAENKPADAENPAQVEEKIVEAEIIEEISAEPIVIPVEDEAAEEAPISETAETIDESILEEPSKLVSEKPQSQGSIVPMAIGGIVAGAIGFGAAYFYPKLTASEAEAVEIVEPAPLADLQTLKSQVEALPLGVSRDEVAGLVEAAVGPLAQSYDDLSRRVEEVSSRLDRALSAPVDAGALTPAALADYQAEIVDLRTELTEQQARIQEMVSSASSQLEQAQAQSEQLSQNAEQATRAAALRTALARIQAALETGTPYQAAIPELEAALGGTVPAEISTPAADGIATLNALQADFDSAADRALATARAEGVDGEETSAFGAFIRNQFDVRSVKPIDGASVDAILSRAQAALTQGRLSDALAEVQTLPEVARAEMTDWTTRAETRSAASAAVDELFFSLNDK